MKTNDQLTTRKDVQEKFDELKAKIDEKTRMINANCTIIDQALDENKEYVKDIENLEHEMNGLIGSIEYYNAEKSFRI